MSIKPGDTVWLVKYAPPRKITKRVVAGVNGDYAKLVNDGWGSYKIGRDCAATEAEAIALADAMRVKKIASLRKQIEKLETLKFESVP